MKKVKKYLLWQAATFIAACAIVLYFMPRDSSSKFHYEEGRPWSYSILTAPFDITVYRDSATIAAMTDSIDAEMVPIFKRDPAPQTRAEAAVESAGHISAHTRSRLAATIRSLYADGIVDPPTAAHIADGKLPEVKINVNNVNTPVATARMRSQRDAYSLIDSLFRDSPDRPAIQTLELARLLEPNLTPDAKATERYRESLLQPVLAGIGVIQQGERIIDQGEIVSPQLYQILKTYEATLDKTTRATHSKMLNTFFGHLLYVVLTFGLVYGFLYLYYPQTFLDPKRVLALMTLPVVFFLFCVLMSKTFSAGIYIVPLAILPLVVMVFFDTRTAFFLLVATTLLCAVAASFPLEFVFLELVAGAAVLFSLKELSRRSELLRSALVAFSAYVCSYLAVELMSTGTVGSLSWRLIGHFAVNSVLISFAYILIFIYEKLFGMVSVVTLVELSDINNPVLRTLSTECPGTFQHSMAVSNLASEAAHHIGANVQLVRAGALYHDIGKIDNPAFFTENQHGMNPHDLLTPVQSARIIIGHIADGLRRAEKAKLPRKVMDLIPQHHGRGKAKYFYITEQKNHPGEEIDPEPFTYPGPNPQSKEASLLMMADAVEAASRSMTDHSDQAISALVDRMIDTQVADGLHNESPLSFRDIRTIKDTFKQRLRTMFHARVSYPEAPKKPAEAPAETPGNEPA